MRRLAIAAMLSVTTGLLACGCMWGIVTDVDTGDPMVGIDVKWKDSHGRWGQTKTGSHGLYIFDVREGQDIPVPGPAEFHVHDFIGLCGAPVQERLLEYDDRPPSTPPADPWEIQNFAVDCGGGEFSRPTVEPYATATPTNSPAPSPTVTPTPGSQFRLPTATPTPGSWFRPLPTATPIPPPR